MSYLSVFSLVTIFAVLLLWYGTCPILRGNYCKGSILFFPYFMLIIGVNIDIVIIVIIICLACPSQIVAQLGG